MTVSCVRTAVVLLASVTLLGCGSQSGRTGNIRTVGRLTQLSEGEMRAGKLVELRGVVTLLDPDWRLLAIQDETGGVLVDWPASTTDLRIGQTIEVKGATSVDNHVPSVVTASLRIVGVGVRPAPVPTSAASIACGQGLYRFVEAEFSPDEGTLGDGTHSANFVTNQPCNRLVAVGRLFRTYSPVSLVGRRIRVRGVPVASYSPDGKLDQVRLMFESEEDVDIPEPPPSGSAPSAVSNSLPELRSIPAVKGLSRTEADRGYPARVEGVVTVLNTRHGGYFIQNGPEAMCIFLESTGGKAPPVGQRVRVSGRTERGGFAPVIRQQLVEMLGPEPLPVPAKVVPGDIFRGWEEDRWVELEGVATAVVADGSANRLQLFVGHQRLQILFSEGDSPGRLQEFVNARISLRGVYAPLYTAGGALTGSRLFASSPDVIRVLVPPAAEPESRTIASLSHFDPRGHPEHRVRVTGTVTLRDTSGRLYLQDGDSAVRVMAASGQTPQLNDRATAEGFLSPDSPTPQLEEVRWLASERGVPVKPFDTLADSLSSLDLDGRLVAVEGFLESRRTSAGELQLSLQAGRSRFTASLEAPGSEPEFPTLRPGVLLRLTGICIAGDDGGPYGSRPAKLWLRGIGDLVVVHPAPWWDLRRVLYAAVVLSLLLVLALAAAVRLRQNLVAQMALRSKLEEQLLQSQKLEGIGRLAGGVAHDFNNYLTVILGYSSLLLGMNTFEDSVRRKLAAIRDVGEKAASLTRQLLAFSRKQVLQPVLCDLNDIIAEARTTLLPLIGEHIEITILAGKTELVYIDPAQFLRVLVNLAANARDAMPNGGRLLVETGLRLFEGAEARANDGVAPGLYVCVSVADTGVGMDAATCKQIFEPFFTTKGPGRGTGLGLAAVFGIIKQSRGHIEVSSTPGEGSCFRLYLPAAEQFAAKGEVPLQDAPEQGNETVLLVEDQDSVRNLVREALETHGFNVLDSSGPREALRLLEDVPGPIHLLLTDVVMPEMSGPALAKEAVLKRPGIRVLFMSGYLEQRVADQIVAGNESGYLEKPFSPSQVTAAVRKALNDTNGVDVGAGGRRSF